MQQAAQPRWTRRTTWRQGHVLGVDAVTAFGLWHADKSSEPCVVVISHDCDIVNDDFAVEPMVEVIVGRIIPAAKGSLAWGKSPRTLHFEMLRNGGPVTVELVATAKTLLPKERLATFVHDDSFAWPDKGLAVLRNWLAVRYNRAAFPDAFVDRMGQRPHEMSSRLAKVLDRYGKVISTVFFDVDAGREVDRSDGSAYDLRIVLAYDSGEDSERAAEDAERAAEGVEKLFVDRLFDGKQEKWDLIRLLRCVPISEEALPVSRAKALMQWRFEHLSLRADNAQPVPLNLKG